MFNPNAHKDSYKTQKEDNTRSPVPPPGPFVVVVVGGQFHITGGKNGNPKNKKLRVKCRILAALKGDNYEEAKHYVGKHLTYDLWWDLDKMGNARRLSHLCIACGVDEEFDPNDNESLANAIKGVPHGIVIDIKERSGRAPNGGGKAPVYRDVVVLETRALTKEKTKKLMREPDFKKSIPSADEFFSETKDWTQNQSSYGGGSSGSATTSSEAKTDIDADPFDDDLPFITDAGIF